MPQAVEAADSNSARVQEHLDTQGGKVPPLQNGLVATQCYCLELLHPKLD